MELWNEMESRNDYEYDNDLGKKTSPQKKFTLFSPSQKKTIYSSPQKVKHLLLAKGLFPMGGSGKSYLGHQSMGLGSKKTSPNGCGGGGGGGSSRKAMTSQKSSPSKFKRVNYSNSKVSLSTPCLSTPSRVAGSGTSDALLGSPFKVRLFSSPTAPLSILKNISRASIGANGMKSGMKSGMENGMESGTVKSPFESVFEMDSRDSRAFQDVLLDQEDHLIDGSNLMDRSGVNVSKSNLKKTTPKKPISLQRVPQILPSRNDSEWLFDDLFTNDSHQNLDSNLSQSGPRDSITTTAAAEDMGFWDTVFTSDNGASQSMLASFDDALSNPLHPHHGSGTARPGQGLYPTTESGSFFDPILYQDPFLNDGMLEGGGRVDGAMVEAAEKVIPRAEVEDLFKDVVQEPSVKSILGSSTISIPRKRGKEVNWIIDCNSGFSIEQTSMLRSQIAQSFQLCAQAFAIERELVGKQENNFWEDQLLRYGRLKAYGLQTIGSTSVFDIPGLEQGQTIASMLPVIPNPEFVASMKDGKKKKEIHLPSSLDQLVGRFESIFSPNLLPKLLPTKQVAKKLFTPSEDALLFQGLLRFGMNDTTSIQHHCLPGRQRSQIYNRVQNVTKRNQAPNIIKEYSLLPFKPMNYLEKYILKQYGKAFKDAAPIVFTHIPGPLIEAAWAELYHIGLVPVQYSENTKMPVKLVKPRKPNAKIPIAPKPTKPTTTTMTTMGVGTQRQQQQQHQPRSSLNHLTSEFDRQIAPAPTPFTTRPSMAGTTTTSEALNSGMDADSIYQTDMENEEDLHHPLNMGTMAATMGTMKDSGGSVSVSSPGPMGIVEKQVRGVGRGSTLRKKRGRKDKDLMEPSTSLKKMRRKLVDVDSSFVKSGGGSLMDKKRKHKPPAKVTV